MKDIGGEITSALVSLILWTKHGFVEVVLKVEVEI